MYHINNPLCNNQFHPIERVFASIADRRGRINNIAPQRANRNRKYMENETSPALRPTPGSNLYFNQDREDHRPSLRVFI